MGRFVMVAALIAAVGCGDPGVVMMVSPDSGVPADAGWVENSDAQVLPAEDAHVEVDAGTDSGGIVVMFPDSGVVVPVPDSGTPDSGTVVVDAGSDAGSMVDAGSDSGTMTGDRSAVVQIAAGHTHTCALRASGRAYCWGSGGFSLGNGRSGNSWVPVEVVDVTDFVSLSAGQLHTCGVRAGGQAVCWGSGGGRTGNGLLLHQTRPTAVRDMTTAVDTAAGEGHSCAILADGTTMCWGSGPDQVGNPAASNPQPLPINVVGVEDATDVDSFAARTCTRDSAGAIDCWGLAPIVMPAGGLSGETVAVGRSFVCTVSGVTHAARCHSLVLASGVPAGSFRDTDGILGQGSTGIVPTPADAMGVTGVTQISAGDTHVCAVNGVQDLYCWGRNDHGQIGNGTTGDPVSRPFRVMGGVVTVDAGSMHTCAGLADGRIMCWGFNSVGQIGTSMAYGTYPSPVEVNF